MRLTLYALSLIAKQEQRTPEEKRRAYKRDWTRRQRAKERSEPSAIPDGRMVDSEALNAG